MQINCLFLVLILVVYKCCTVAHTCSCKCQFRKFHKLMGILKSRFLKVDWSSPINFKNLLLRGWNERHWSQAGKKKTLKTKQFTVKGKFFQCIKIVIIHYEVHITPPLYSANENQLRLPTKYKILFSSTCVKLRSNSTHWNMIISNGRQQRLK